ncbi:hypothetical protein FOL47_002891 [Perkinsus chesapeaki]|uniref:EF-hand domain-containing protein n=1 Tax=Perkinsus chesapeaki TaxID=330153 RepID=A0A7J6MBF5_PERCH|nr:hypothetical protein FOL47_002891 [Perkinsus chesapeaki]
MDIEERIVEHLDQPPTSPGWDLSGEALKAGFGRRASTLKKANSLEELFREFDEDGSGCLDIKELGHLLRSMGYTVPQHAIEKFVLPVVTDGKNTEIRVDQLYDVVELVKQLLNKNDRSPDDPLDISIHEGETHIQQLYRVLREASVSLSDNEVPVWGRSIEQLIDERSCTWNPRTCRGTRKLPAPKKRDTAAEIKKLYALTKGTIEFFEEEIAMESAMSNSLKQDLNQTNSKFKRVANKGQQVIKGVAQENFALASQRAVLEAQVSSLQKELLAAKAAQEAENTAFEAEKREHRERLENCRSREEACQARGKQITMIGRDLVGKKRLRLQEYAELLSDKPRSAQLERILHREECEREVLLTLLSDLHTFLRNESEVLVPKGQASILENCTLVERDLSDLLSKEDTRKISH